jgi:UDP-N-acetyl-D-mannosaminuronic acid transferase (WecB/TagA/CpsF family)
MQTVSAPALGADFYRRILGVQFFVGRAPQAVEVGVRGGLMVAPAAPALLDLERDHGYREALLESDLVITDSGFLVLLWNAMTSDKIHRVSGLEYLKLLLSRPEFRESDSVLWVMPTEAAAKRSLDWLQARGFSVTTENFYVAPKYSPHAVRDDALAALINERRPAHVIIAIGGGIQEKLGLYLKRQCAFQPGIHCIGAAIGFLTGDQVSIPDWADRMILGWLFRCVSNPNRFLPRYARAVKLALVLMRYRARLPELKIAPERN